MNKDININKGFGNINFGQSISEIITLLNEPDYTEEINTDDDEGASIVYMYDKYGIVAFFEGVGEKMLSILEVKDTEALLFGNKIFEMTEDEIVEMMKQHGYKEIDIELLIWGGKRITFEDGNIDFYFDDNALTTVSWGVLILDDGTIA